jgi:hypothetical protein
MSKENNPIFVVESSNQDYTDKDYNFGKREPIRSVDSSFRDNVKLQVENVEESFRESFSRWPNVPGVAKVTLYEKAYAKSHRPDSFFCRNSCPIIGTLGLGELLISVTPSGIKSLKDRVSRSLNTHSGKLNLAVVETIEPYEMDQNIIEDDTYVLNLFNHNDRFLDKSLRDAIEGLTSENGCTLSQHYIGKDTSFFQLSNCASVEFLTQFVGVRSIKPMPRYRVGDYSGQSIQVGVLTESLFPAPEKGRNYPLVGIIDSGIDPDDKYLSPWVWGRMDMLDGKEADYSHGTMVASLAINSFTLNNSDERFPKTQVEIVDVVAFPKDGDLTLVDLMDIIEKSVKTYPEVKVWNLSLGTPFPCDEQSFSELGHFLNTLHDQNGCLFIIASGNYVEQPQREWPPQNGMNGSDRVSMPGDSVRSLTVGSLAHKDHSNTVVKELDPSSFSRCGPGPSFTPKPDLAHFGGNCDSNLDFSQVGVLGIGVGGSRVENIGTSFATPIVSSMAANVWQELEVNGSIDPTPERIKALLIHGSLLQEGRITTDETRYKGFGHPASVEDMIACENSEATFLFEVDTKEGESFGREPFVIPEGMRTEDGKFAGEVIMTLVYSPLLNYEFPSEYCRSNVDVRFGVWDGKSFTGKIPQLKSKSEMYEKALVENGFKWSPVKVYKKSFKGIAADDWKLILEVMRRAEEKPLEAPQRAVALITLRSLDPTAQVYQEAKILMNQANWQVDDLTQRPEQEILVRS